MRDVFETNVAQKYSDFFYKIVHECFYEIKNNQCF